jgi:hypothetical protein
MPSGLCRFRSRISLVGIATGWTTGVRFLVRARDFSLLHSVQTGFQAYLASYLMGTGRSIPGDREADHSPPSSTDVKNGGAIPPLSHTCS